MFRYIAISIVLSSSAWAQNLDNDLWDALTKATSEISMPLSAHQQVQRVLQEAKKEAEMRAYRKAKQEKTDAK